MPGEEWECQVRICRSLCLCLVRELLAVLQRGSERLSQALYRWTPSAESLARSHLGLPILTLALPIITWHSQSSPEMEMEIAIDINIDIEIDISSLGTPNLRLALPILTSGTPNPHLALPILTWHSQSSPGTPNPHLALPILS